MQGVQQSSVFHNDYFRFSFESRTSKKKVWGSMRGGQSEGTPQGEDVDMGQEKPDVEHLRRQKHQGEGEVEAVWGQEEKQENSPPEK